MLGQEFEAVVPDNLLLIGPSSLWNKIELL